MKFVYVLINCGELYYVILNLSLRDVYRCVIVYIDKDFYKNCCVIEDVDVFKLYLWKVIDFFVKIMKDKSMLSSIIFFYFKELEYLKCLYC